MGRISIRLWRRRFSHATLYSRHLVIAKPSVTTTPVVSANTCKCTSARTTPSRAPASKATSYKSPASSPSPPANAHSTPSTPSSPPTNTTSAPPTNTKSSNAANATPPPASMTPNGLIRSIRPCSRLNLKRQNKIRYGCY